MKPPADLEQTMNATTEIRTGLCLDDEILTNSRIVSACEIEAPNGNIIDQTKTREVVRVVRQLLRRGCVVDGVYFDEGKREFVAVREVARRDVYLITGETRRGAKFEITIPNCWIQDWDNKISAEFGNMVSADGWVYDLLNGR
jgi:hypothetical protein